MLAQVLEECRVLLQSCFQPGNIDRADVLVGCIISGFRHSQRVSLDSDRNGVPAFDLRSTYESTSCSVRARLCQPHLFRVALSSPLRPGVRGSKLRVS